MKRFLFVLCLALAVVVAVTGCSRDESKKVLAKVGNRKITVGDFRELYMRMPPGYIPEGDTPEGKKRFLEDLVNKEFLVLEAYEKGLDKDSTLVKEMASLEQRVFLRELYNREVITKAQVTEKETKDFYDERTKENELHVRHILVSTPEKAKEVLGKARAGEDFAQLAMKYSEDNTSAPAGGDIGFLVKEMLPPELQDAVFSLKPGEISDTLKTAFGYHIIKVEEARQRQLDPFEQMKPRLESELMMRKRMDLAKTYLENIKRDYDIKINEETLKVLIDGVGATAGAQGSSIKNLMEYFTDEQKSRVLAKAKTGDYTLGDFLTALQEAGMGTIPQDSTPAQIRDMVEGEIITKPLVEEARRTGVGKEESVKRDLERMKEEKMVNLLYETEVRPKVTISDDDIRAYYETHKEKYGTPGSVRFLKLVVGERTTADSLFALAKRGADFAKLIKENSIDERSVASGGSVDLKVGSDSIIDSLTADLKVGQIAGPVPISGGFLIIKLLGKKPPVITPIELAWTHVQNDVRAEREEIELQALLSRLREKYKPTINEKLLAEIKLQEMTEPAQPRQ